MCAMDGGLVEWVGNELILTRRSVRSQLGIGFGSMGMLRVSWSWVENAMDLNLLMKWHVDDVLEIGLFSSVGHLG